MSGALRPAGLRARLRAGGAGHRRLGRRRRRRPSLSCRRCAAAVGGWISIARLGRSRRLRRRVPGRADRPVVARRHDRRRWSAARRSAASTARWAWYSASRAARCWWSSPISSPAWWSRSSAGREPVLDARAAAAYVYGAPTGCADQLPRRLPPAHPIRRRPGARHARTTCCVPRPQGRATGKPPVQGSGVVTAWLIDTALTTDDDDKLHEECGVFGIWNVPDAAARHRAGAARAAAPRPGSDRHRHASTATRFHSHRGLGLVGDNFGDAAGDRPRCPAASPSAITAMPPPATRCCATCSRSMPISSSAASRSAHNGNLTNAHVAAPRAGAPRLPVPVDHRHRGVHPPDRHQPVFHRGGPADRRAEAGDRRLFAGRAVQRGADGRARPAGRAPADPGPHRHADGTGGWVLASETCALDIVGADFVRDVEPGEIVVINDQGVHSIKPFASAPRTLLRVRIHLFRPPRLA